MTRVSGPAAWRELQRRKARAANFVPHTPHPKQKVFLDLDCLEALYGGAAGGGKTNALLMQAARYVHVPGYSALILRRTYRELSKPDSIMDRAHQWWDPHPSIRWEGQEKRFTFPSGARVTFGYLDNERDKYQYASAAYQCVIFDELTEFPLSWYTFLFSRLRRLEGSDVPIRMRAASNPGGIGHDWVFQRFVEGAEPGTAFVPALATDNPSLDVEDYYKQLDRLDPITRQQLKEGVWVRDGGGLVYGHFRESLNLTPAPPKLTYYLLGLDFGIQDENAVTVLGWRDNDPCIYVLESYRLKAGVNEMADEAARLGKTYDFVKIVGDEGGMGKGFADEMRKRYIPIEPAQKTNKVGYVALMNADFARGRIKVVARTCGDLIDEWRKLPWNASRTKEAEGFKNHASDATLYAWRACTAYHEVAQAEQPKPNTPEYWRAKEAEELQRLDDEIAEEEREERATRFW